MEWPGRTALEQAVAAVSELITQGADSSSQRHGETGMSSVQAMRSLLADQLGERPSYEALWRGFEADPNGMAADMLGTLEALVEGNPSLAQELAVLLAEYEIAIGPPPSAGSGLREAKVPETEEVPVTGQEPDIGDGEYLYGNVQPGTVTLEEEGLLDRLSPEQVTELRQLDTEGAVLSPALDDLHEIVNANPDLAPDEKEHLDQELQAVLDELSEQSAADTRRLVDHLGEIGRIEPDVLSAVLDRTEADAAKLGLPASLAAREMRAWLAGTESA